VTELLCHDLTRAILGASMTVLNTLKPGLDEKIYERSLVIELLELGHKVNQQQAFPVTYKNQNVGVLVPDLIVDDQVIVDLKVVTEWNDQHIAQMLGYLAISGLSLGLLINFHDPTLKWKRVVR